METSTSHVAIVGAGPAGLLLAYILHQASVPFTIFESRSQTTHLSQQGGSLDFHTKTGLFALREAGLLPTILPHARTSGNGVTLTDKHQKVWFAWPGGASKPEIDRADLIALLLSTLPQNFIKWSHPVLSATAGHLYFTTTSSLPPVGPFTLIVGCDGAWSRVRHRLTTTVPYPTGVFGQRFTIAHASRSTISLLRDLAKGSGARFAFADHSAMILHRLANDRASITLFQAHTPALGTPTVPEKSPLRTTTSTFKHDTTPNPVSVAKTLATDYYADWDAQLLNVLSSIPADASVNTWNLHALPIGFRWPHVPGITCIGDAAHVMPPFGGEGVNLALLDAWLLGSTIVNNMGSNKLYAREQGESLNETVREFEERMWFRASRGQSLSHQLMQCMMFEKGVPRSVVGKWLMIRAWYETSPRMWPVMKVVIGAMVHGFYGALKLFR